MRDLFTASALVRVRKQIMKATVRVSTHREIIP